MYINAHNEELAPLYDSPNDFAHITAYIPHATQVTVFFLRGMWYLMCWQGRWGFIPSIFLSPFDPSPSLWTSRYGADTMTMERSMNSNRKITHLQNDLNAFFAPFKPQIIIDGQYGPETANAITMFQTIRTLPANGDATPETKAALFNATLRLRSKGRQ